MMPLTPHVPRGLRNNNPGNLRRVEGTAWKGQEATQTDPDFVQFVTPEYGIRAMARILHNYKRDGLNTIHEAISRWAPSNENDTNSYIQDVCNGCSVQPTDVVDFDLIMPSLIKAIIFHENGVQPYSDDQINKGIALSL
jgi:hypothetical protein